MTPIKTSSDWLKLACAGCDKLFTIASAMMIYVSTLPLIPACFWKRKVVKRSTPLSQNPNSPLEQIRIFLAWRNKTPHRGVLPVLPSIYVYFKNAHKSKKCVIIVAIDNAKLRLLKVFSSYNNALCDSSKLFFTTINPWGYDVILRFRRISLNIPQGFMHMPR